MFSLRLQKATQTREFLISDVSAEGWEIREERDSVVVRVVRYGDWHRVERARRVFEREVAELREHGWTVI